MRFGIIIFPGTWSDKDCYYAINNIIGHDAGYVWHKETDLSQYDCIVLPGGFSYGDYLRPGAIARFSPVMAAVEQFASQGKLVIGICNGFQVLCESGLLPGVLLPNEQLSASVTDFKSSASLGYYPESYYPMSTWSTAASGLISG